MNSFSMEIAGQVGAVTPLFETTRIYFQSYLTDRAPDFSVTVTREALSFEQEALRREAMEEGMRVRVFTDPFLERAAIQRKFAEHLLRHSTLLLHGSSVAVDAEGYLFTAKCGTGKSTHTRLWRQLFGSRAIPVNDDKPFLRMTENGVLLCGSPWSGKHGLDTNICVPLKAICILTRGSANQVRPITPQEAMPMLLHQSFPPLAQAQQQDFRQLVDRLAHAVPLWHMACTKDIEAAAVSYEALSGKSAPKEVCL